MKRLPMLLLIFALSPPAAASAAKATEIVQEAYDLRLAGKVDEAVTRLEEGLAADSTQAVLYYELARAKMFLMDFDGMQSAIEKAVAIADDNATYHYFAGQASAVSVIDAAHHKREDRMKHFATEAVDQLKAAVRCDPDDFEARCMLVQLLSAMAGDMGWDLKQADEHVGYLEEKAYVFGAKARSYLIPDDQRAGLWEKVVREHPDDWQAWYEAASGFIDAGNLDRAAECLDKSIQMHPERQYLLLRLGTAFAMAWDWDRATATTKRYIDTNPPLPLLAFAWARLGQIQERSGDAASGQKLMDKAEKMDPHLWRAFMPPGEDLFTRP